MSVILITPVIIIAVIVLIVVGSRGKWEEEGEVMLKNIYHYLVLFATLMMVIGGSIGVFMSVADLISPAPHYQSFEEYRQFSLPEGEKSTQTRSEDDLRAAYDDMIKLEEERSHKRAINSLIKSFGWIIIPLPIFIYFQRRLRQKE